MGVDRVDLVTLDELADQSPLHVLEIAERTDEHPVAVDQACARLHDTGAILSVGRGKYELTETGRRHRSECSEVQQPGGPTP